jgi:hypothetical protein
MREKEDGPEGRRKGYRTLFRQNKVAFAFCRFRPNHRQRRTSIISLMLIERTAFHNSPNEGLYDMKVMANEQGRK